MYHTCLQCYLGLGGKVTFIETPYFLIHCRRIELFGEDHNLRPGWVTVGKAISTSNFDKSSYSKLFSWPSGLPYIATPRGVKPRVGQPNLLT